ncbi:hypothetical protein [Bordetella genomosp. 9]|uniref:Uncharacterized protein n=1 Tax=Bordetella genomosp. 9 TaxID=1416803 RepID=A0A1W6Z6E9_9BORD|nr:hypothetical protein [Bordetella genomosp. 9]ARP88383.1 hypothetical protein CAL13_20795 [Bordetella genomosp. 9]
MEFMQRWGLPPWAGWMALVVLIIMVEGAVALYHVKRRHDRTVRETQASETIRRTGASASAQVLQATDTGVRLGADRFFIWKLRLAVQPAASEALADRGVAADSAAGELRLPFETEIKVPISPARFADFAEGRQIRVRVEPGTHSVVVDQRTE